ncbi:MAG: hypothetical protein PHN80_06330 [Hespellia sp.]|nr:hypothetical protein [Hespellia sp.]
MKLIRVTTDEEITLHDFPEGTHSEQNEVLRKLIGDDCRLYEHVRPQRLYTDLHMVGRPTKIAGQCVCMLVDEEFALKPDPVPNYIGSYLYETDRHGNPILGNVLFVGEEWSGDGIDFCGIADATLEILHRQLINMAFAMKATKEVLE